MHKIKVKNRAKNRAIEVFDQKIVDLSIIKRDTKIATLSQIIVGFDK